MAAACASSRLLKVVKSRPALASHVCTFAYGEIYNEILWQTISKTNGSTCLQQAAK